MGNRMRTLLLLVALVLAFPAMAQANPNEDYAQGMTAATKGDMDTAIAAFGRIIANPANTLLAAEYEGTTSTSQYG